MYKVTKGIYLEELFIIVDKRVNARYDNVILSKIASDCMKGCIHDREDYLQSLPISNFEKKIVDNHFDFALEHNLITRSVIFNIWSESRPWMIAKFLLALIPFSITSVPFYIINDEIRSSALNNLILFFLVYLLIIFVHEISHACTYWWYEKSMNGYFCVSDFSFSFCYSSENISVKDNKKVCISGVLFSCITLALMLVVFQESWLIFLLNIFIQIISFFYGNDYKIIKNTELKF